MTSQTMSSLYWAIGDGFELRSYLSDTQLPSLCYISVDSSTAFEYDLTSPYPLQVLCSFADTNREGSIQLLVVDFYRLF